MTQPVPPPAGASEPAGATHPTDSPERRLRRGCLPIILLLLVAVVVNFFQYGINVVTIVGSVLLAVAVVALILISREEKVDRSG